MCSWEKSLWISRNVILRSTRRILKLTSITEPTGHPASSCSARRSALTCSAMPVRKINLGRDTRLSSPRLRDALMRGLKASGCHVTDLGVVPTPVLYFSQFHLKADGAVMITGSHNPAEFNGFKTVCGQSTIHGEAIQELRRMMESGDLVRGEGSETTADCVTPYVEEIAAQFQFPRRVKVVIDAGNGTGGPVMHRLLEHLNADATEMYFEMDGRFPNHHPDPTVPKNLEAL